MHVIPYCHVLDYELFAKYIQLNSFTASVYHLLIDTLECLI